MPFPVANSSWVILVHVSFIDGFGDDNRLPQSRLRHNSGIVRSLTEALDFLERGPLLRLRALKTPAYPVCGQLERLGARGSK